jgi:uncharacterized protein
VTLKTCIAQTQDSTKRINNFEKAAGLVEGKHEGQFFDDSDVYKAMEGIAYSLINNPNPKYEALLDRWIVLIAKSQQPDGYLNTFYTLNHPEKRWTDMFNHEMYCGGHMIEAAIAHKMATGKTNFLDIAIKFADHLDSTFGPGKRNWVPGHQEIELALVKLYHETGQKRYLNLAYWLLEQRGKGHGVWTRPNRGEKYSQDDIPVSQIADIKGHAVRAMYLFAGMADVAGALDILAYVKALERVWENVVYKNMYITGGIGSSKDNEGFTEDYHLPNKTAYCETCASIGMVFWNHRMNMLFKDGKFVDVLERSLYNGTLSGVSLDGDRFFYVNPLESDGDHHRQRWFGTACCPSNIARLIPSVGNYIYLTGKDELYINLFIGNTTNVRLGDTQVNLVQKTNYPWDGKISLIVNPESPVSFTAKIRKPGWCNNYSIAVNNKQIINPIPEDGYKNISREWKSGDKITLTLDMPVELIAADPRVIENIGKRAVQRGPLVYCLEEVDNKNLNFDKVSLDKQSTFRITHGKGNLKNMVLLKTSSGRQKLIFNPYFAWDNREAGKMKVWINYKIH